MGIEAHLKELRRKHRELDEAITVATRHPGACSLTISRLKKERLRYKDRIAQIEHGGAAIHHLSDFTESDEAEDEPGDGDLSLTVVAEGSIQAVG